MQFQKFQNEFFEFFVFSVDFQPHHVEAGARLHLFFHDLGKIALNVGIVDIRVEIGVARDAHHHSAARGVTGKGVVSERAHEFFERHEAAAFSPPPIRYSLSSAALNAITPTMCRPSRSRSYSM